MATPFSSGYLPLLPLPTTAGPPQSRTAGSNSPCSTAINDDWEDGEDEDVPCAYHIENVVDLAHRPPTPYPFLGHRAGDESESESTDSNTVSSMASDDISEGESDEEDDDEDEDEDEYEYDEDVPWAYHAHHRIQDLAHRPPSPYPFLGNRAGDDSEPFSSMALDDISESESEEDEDVPWAYHPDPDAHHRIQDLADRPPTPYPFLEVEIEDRATELPTTSDPPLDLDLDEGVVGDDEDEDEDDEDACCAYHIEDVARPSPSDHLNHSHYQNWNGNHARVYRFPA